MVEIRRLHFISIIAYCTLFYPSITFNAYFIDEKEIISTSTRDDIAVTILAHFFQQIDALVSMSTINDSHLIQAVGMIRRSFLEQQMNHQLNGKRVLYLIEKFNNWLVWYEQQSQYDSTHKVFLYALHEVSMQVLRAIRRETCNDGVMSPHYTKNKKVLFIALASVISCVFYHVRCFSRKDSFFNRLLGALHLQKEIYSQQDKQTKLESDLTITANGLKYLGEKNSCLIEALSNGEKQKVNTSTDSPQTNVDKESLWRGGDESIKEIQSILSDLLNKFTTLKEKLKNSILESKTTLNRLKEHNTRVKDVEGFFKQHKLKSANLIFIYEGISKKLTKKPSPSYLKRDASREILDNVFGVLIPEVAALTGKPVDELEDYAEEELSKQVTQNVQKSRSELNIFNIQRLPQDKDVEEAKKNLDQLLHTLRLEMGELVREYEALNTNTMDGT